ncbi:hypothetical protein EDM57_04740 [Brevibacillus gelatini]|uniref:Accessory regulator AgrB n=1 Tax=Brevibacillus gelatini TaxID=1655277 RepID=A0A3M8B810_9BACL|nr:accessory gene regulator B family protein [Brevibacillus gelatini]RNB59453.1 hypothetical protein EDM57_04740 [Brevibacillus gelatini]
MIEALAYKIAVKIKSINPNETSSIEVMKFSLIMLIGTGSAIFLSLLLASLLGSALETIIVLISFVSLRFFSGGFHFKSAELCTIFSVIGAVLIPYVPVSDKNVFVITLISIFITALLAPIGVNQSKFFTKKHDPLLKLISIFIILLNLIIESDILAVTFFVQSLTLVIYKTMEGGDCK